MPDNEMIMAQHRHCLETVFQCIEDHEAEDEELITNALETIVNLAPLLDLRIFSSSKPSFIRMTAVDRLLKIVRTPHPVPEVCRKAAMILESLVSEPQNRVALLAP
ncbi:hypothetical protein J5N97_017573 [Dioscorea zingiberensis]|uniref:Uncharacterized protein n=1 Tax=Dioscorea zingiberensis TaxID=325984 RepID=A0A9D5CNG3_9LILI|nr:hypothetical protein J5N97_017573 [Dioscorea zingiberensis]